MADGEIGTWYDPETGQGYSGPKESETHLPADPETGQPTYPTYGKPLSFYKSRGSPKQPADQKVSVSPDEAYKAGIISENEYTKTKDQPVYYEVPEQVLAEAEKASKIYPRENIPSTKSPLSMAIQQQQTAYARETQREEMIKRIAEQPAIKASYVINRDFFGIGTLSEVAVSVLSGQDWTEHSKMIMYNYASELVSSGRSIDEAFFQESMIAGAKASLFAFTGGVAGKPLAVATTTAGRALYGASLGLQIGRTIKEPSGTELARTFVYSSPLLVGGIAKGLQMRLSGPTQKSMKYSLRVEPKEKMKPTLTKEQIKDIGKAWSKGADDYWNKPDKIITDQGVIKTAKPSPPKSPVKSTPSRIVTGSGSGSQQLQLKQLSDIDMIGTKQKNPFAGLNELMGSKSGQKVTMELELEYIRYPPRTQSLKLMPMMRSDLQMQKQLQLQLIGRKAELKLMQKQDQITDELIGTKQKQGLMQGSRQDQRQRQEIGIKQTQASIQKQEQALGQQQVQRQAQRQAQLQKQMLGTSSRPPRGPPPSIFDSPFNRGRRTVERISKALKPSKKFYQPSLGGVFSGRRISKAPKSVQSGLGIREPVSRKGRKRKKLTIGDML